MLDILRLLEQLWDSGRTAAIATIVHTSGSTYRAVGAKGVILPDGTIYGTLSGGCVEADLWEHAAQVMETLIPRIIEYDFYADGKEPWGLGTGCNGALKIWIEPFDPRNRYESAFEMLSIYREQLPSWTVICSDRPDRYPKGKKYIQGQAQPALLREAPGASGLYAVECGDAQVEVYFEKLKRIPRLIIFGAGSDAVPLARGAKLLNWHVTVVDHRPAYANKARFPEADELIVSEPGKLPEQLTIRDDDYAVIMTHHFEQDTLYLRHLLTFRLSYVGILGPKHRTNRMLESGAVPPGQQGEALHSPVGLDIGAETPEEIAISILSEIMMHVNGSTGTSLKHRNGPIHRKASEPGNRLQPNLRNGS
ncbi:XdhC family protein [Paenibacillus thermotolerans]|uniref:XdhC family protein n=1 Tax=Paenibacillus thermotolerans TaxID=3027807 RepID=UPI0023681D58|nr:MULTISPECIES: XdhC/CoxI family protein [unclassified Paenibacillus]